MISIESTDIKERVSYQSFLASTPIHQIHVFHIDAIPSSHNDGPEEIHHRFQDVRILIIGGSSGMVSLL